MPKKSISRVRKSKSPVRKAKTSVCKTKTSVRKTKTSVRKTKTSVRKTKTSVRKTKSPSKKTYKMARRALGHITDLVAEYTDNKPIEIFRNREIWSLRDSVAVRRMGIWDKKTVDKACLDFLKSLIQISPKGNRVLCFYSDSESSYSSYNDEEMTTEKEAKTIEDETLMFYRALTLIKPTFPLDKIRIGRTTGMTDYEMNVLVSALPTFKSLQYLEIFNYITDSQLIILAHNLKKTKLKKLYLGFNNDDYVHYSTTNVPFGIKGLTALAEALKTNTTLEDLDLQDNKIGDDGAFVLADALKTNTTLEELNLNNNGISRRGGDALEDALKTNTTLRNIYGQYGHYGCHSREEIKRKGTYDSDDEYWL